MSTGQSNNRNSHFRKGRGVFVCVGCGHRTRDTGVNNGTDCCPDCYELAGIYNHFQDGGNLASYKKEIVKRCQNIKTKGGTLDGDCLELLQAIGAEVPT